MVMPKTSFKAINIFMYVQFYMYFVLCTCINCEAHNSHIYYTSEEEKQHLEMSKPLLTRMDSVIDEWTELDAEFSELQVCVVIRSKDMKFQV